MEIEAGGCGFQMVIIQLLFFLYKSGEAMLDVTTRPYIVQAVCQDIFSYNETICYHLGMLQNEEDHIQSVAGNYLMLYRLVLNLPSVVLALFCGSYSDRHGRKILIMMPSFGSVLGVQLYILSLMWSSIRIPLILAGATIQGCFGKSSIITMAVNSYVSDATELQERSKQLGKLLAMNYFGHFAGSLLSGFFQDATDISTTFCVAVFIHSTVVMLTVFGVKESNVSKTAKVNDAVIQSKENDKIEECCTLFRLSNVREAGVVLFRKREFNMRFLVLTMFAIAVIMQTCKVGEVDIMVLFVARTPLKWPRTWYGYLMSVDQAAIGLCLFFVLPILTGLLQLSDATVLCLGLSCKLVKLILVGFSTKTWVVFASVIIGAFHGMASVSIRSSLSKIVEANEVGKIFSLLAFGETLSKLLGVVIFLNLYSTTAHIFSGFAFMVEATVYAVVLALVIFLFKHIKTIGTKHLIKEALIDKTEYESIEHTTSETAQLGFIEEYDNLLLNPAAKQ